MAGDLEVKIDQSNLYKKGGKYNFIKNVYKITISVRRLMARPSGVSLGSIGWEAPKPFENSLDGSMSLFIR